LQTPLHCSFKRRSIGYEPHILGGLSAKCQDGGQFKLHRQVIFVIVEEGVHRIKVGTEYNRAEIAMRQRFLS